MNVKKVQEYNVLPEDLDESDVRVLEMTSHNLG